MSFTHKKFAQVLNQYQYTFHTGDIIAGTIFSEETEGFLVDIGNQTAGYLPKAELFLTHISSEDIKINETQEFFILAHNLEAKQLILSLKRLKYIRAWDRIKQLKNEDITLEAHVRGSNKGGLLIEIEEIQGFIPNSHLCYTTQNKKNFINKNILCKFLVADEQTNQLILSNRCAITEKLMQKIKVGDLITAEVIKVTSFGIFFNIYSIPALLHKSEIENAYSNNMNNIFSKGKKCALIIMHIDSKQGRISVSMTRN
uniref:Ribosomal protein S1 n=1 Tax=Liagoropsis maxima TaxID=1653392 RepID=A0A1G4NW07_9FLOR|nr:Ribosomal protein S1 [Liagoropsis maxima]SCW22871.1 Ribosomal protein S1 [Liagoropsis maxima]